MADSVVFSRLIEEYGSQEEEEEGEVIDERRKRQKAKAAGSDESTEEAGPKKASDPLMQLEERNTGAVTWSIYKDYLRFAGGVSWAPFIILFLTLTQAAQGAVLFILQSRVFRSFLPFQSEITCFSGSGLSRIYQAFIKETTWLSTLH